MLLISCRAAFICMLLATPSSDSDQATTQYDRDLCACMNSLYPANSTVLICVNLSMKYRTRSSDYNCIKRSNALCFGFVLEFY